MHSAIIFVRFSGTVSDVDRASTAHATQLKMRIRGTCMQCAHL
jgi:hypothetical protein